MNRVAKFNVRKYGLYSVSGDPYPQLILEIQVTSPKDAFVVCSLVQAVLSKEDTSEKFPMDFAPKDNMISEGRKTIKFYKEISPAFIRKLEDFRGGSNLRLGVKVDMWFLSYDFDINVQAGKIGEVMRMDWSNEGRPGAHLIITREEWIKRVLKPLGFGKRLIVEIPCELPEIVILKPANKILQDFRERVVRAAKELQLAVEKSAKGDKDGAIEKVRKATDALLKNLLRKEDVRKVLAECLMVRSGTATTNVAPEFIDNFYRIVEALFDLSSKGPHAVTKRGELMEYHPELIDAETLTGLALMVVRYVSQKFEKSMKF